MNRLNELADAIEKASSIGGGIDIPTWKEAAALLRAAAAETVGHIWEDDSENCNPHNTDIAAASLAVADARRERDEARQMAYMIRPVDDRNPGVSWREAYEILDEKSLEQKQGHACAMATLAEERDALQRERDEARAERDEALNMRDSTLKDRLDNARKEWDDRVRKMMDRCDRSYDYGQDRLHEMSIAYRTLTEERDALQRERDEARAECERLRMQVVACGVLAGSDTPESLARNSQMHPDYMCDSVRYCIDAAQRQIDRLAQIATLQKERGEAVRVLDAANDSNERLRAAINRMEQAELSALAELDEANAKLRDREAELLRCRTHETAAAHELDCKLNTEERHEFKRLSDSLAEKQRAIDEAYGIAYKAVYNEERNDLLKVYDILRPHATRRDGQQANPSEMPKSSPVPTRELVARLAEVIKDWASLPEPVMHSCVPDVDAIIRDARKGGAE